MINPLRALRQPKEPQEVTVCALVIDLGDESDLPKISKVSQYGPTTVVWWEDGEKTAVTCSECRDGLCLKAKDYQRPEGEPPMRRPLFCAMRYDPEKALMAALLKRVAHGWQDVLRPWVPEVEADE